MFAERRNRDDDVSFCEKVTRRQQFGLIRAIRRTESLAVGICSIGRTTHAQYAACFRQSSITPDQLNLKGALTPTSETTAPHDPSRHPPARRSAPPGR